MASIDIRNKVQEEVTEIIFADEKGQDTVVQAYKIEKYSDCGLNPYILIVDGEQCDIVVNTVEHANNLIKALNKAIALGWLK